MPRAGFVDDGDGRAARAVVLCEFASLQQRNAHGAEVIRRADADVGVVRRLRCPTTLKLRELFPPENGRRLTAATRSTPGDAAQVCKTCL